VGTRSLEQVEFRPGLPYGQPVDPGADRRRRKRRLRWLALAALVAVAAAGAIVAIDRLTPVSPPYEGTDELAEAIENAGYECEPGRTFSDDFRGGMEQTAYCDLFRDGERITPEGGGLELHVYTPADAGQAFRDHERQEGTSVVDALVGENWFIIGLGEDPTPRLRQVRDDLLEEMEDASVGKFPTGTPDEGELSSVTRRAS
jgi:hypothetical protein